MNKVLFPKIAAEGYCCVGGYLRLCEARGESRKAMCENLGLNHKTLAHHYQKLAKGGHQCQKYSECLEPIIAELKTSPR